LLLLGGAAAAHDEWRTSDVTVDAGIAKVGASVVMPAAGPNIPCVVIAGGSLSGDRNGRMQRAGVPARDALFRLAEALRASGYGSIRYDRVGVGASKPGPAWSGTYTDEGRVLAAVVRSARKLRNAGSIIVAGESAGGYLACLAAKLGAQADGYIFLGAHCGPGPEIYQYNFGRLAELARKQPELPWLSSMKFERAIGLHYEELFAAAQRGEETYELVEGDFRATLELARRREELEMPPDEMFKQIRAPVLALAGQYDLNVPPDHAARIVQVLKASGNERATAITIAAADHSFQAAAETEEQRLRERYTFESFSRPYQADAYRQIAAWLREVFPTSAEAHDETLLRIASGAIAPPAAEAAEKGAAPRARERVEVDPVTSLTPERVHLAPGIEIIADVTDRKKTAGVSTLEGRIGPLILGEGSQAHFIDMPAGMYVKEHPHSTESIIYTVRGQWVLCSSERRHVMKPGSLFRFAPNTPTGYEVPFDEDAFILIFKGDRVTKDEQSFIEYLTGFAERLKKEQKEGVPYLLVDLPEDHAARQFARDLKTKAKTP
jgi:hypothetical protein